MFTCIISMKNKVSGELYCKKNKGADDMENENMYRKMVVIFVDLLGTKNNKRFEDKFLIHRLFHEEVKTNERRNMGHVIYDRKIEYIYAVSLKAG